MIVFITSIKHPKNSKSYDHVWRLLSRTLASVCNQINQDFKVIIVCNHTLPLETKYDQFVEFIEVGFPPVDQSGYDGIRIDRGSKYIIGLIAAKKHNPDYIMFFDADDYVGNDISLHANTHIGGNGWIINKGYTLAGNKLRREEANFNKICGTSNILNYQLVMTEIYSDLTEESGQDEILDKTDEYYLKFVIGSHKFAEPYFNKKGSPLSSFPNYAAVYVTGTGENHSDFIGYSQNVMNMQQQLKWQWSDISAEQMHYFNINNSD